MDPGSMLEGRSRETKIRRDSRGRWWNGDDAITHPLLVAAFDSWIERAEDGRYCLKNDINWAYVTIEGAPISVRSVVLGPDDVVLHLSDGRTELLATGTLREDADGVLHCDVRGGTMPARFEPHAAMQLAPITAEDDVGIYLAIGADRVRPRVVADPLAPLRDPVASRT